MAHQWTAEQKARAVEVYAETGNLAEGQRAVQLDDGTEPAKNSIKAWAKAAGHDIEEISARAAEKTKHATEVSAQAWAERRARLVDDAGLVAEVALVQTAYFIDVGNPKNAKDAATTFGILVDKAQVLSGEATSIVRTPWDPKAVTSEAQPRAEGLRSVPTGEAVTG